MGREARRAAGALLAVAISGLCVVLTGCGGSTGEAGASVARFKGGDAVPAKAAPPIRLTDYRNRPVNLAGLKGRPVLVAFLYTHCHDLCPLVASKVHAAFSMLGRHERRPIVLAVSVDPARDTPASATKFNREHRTTGEIDWLLGSRAELAKVWKAWKIAPERRGNDPEVIEHSADIYGIGADGRIHVLYPPNFNPALLAGDVRLLTAL